MRILPILVAATLTACSTPAPEVATATQQPGDPFELSGCDGIPADFDLAATRETRESSGSLLVSPALPEPGQPVWVLVKSLFPRYYDYPGPARQAAFLRHSGNGWAETPMTDLCPDSVWPVWGENLGAQPEGTVVRFAIRQRMPASFQTEETWMNNRGRDYEIEYRHREPWVGGSRLVLAGEAAPADAIAAGVDLTVLAETYPMGAARAVELRWEVPSTDARGSVAMTLDRTAAGPYGNNAQWTAVVPGSVLRGGAQVRAHVTARFADDQAIDDAALSFVPRGFEVQWAGGFGQYRPTARDYREGDLFEDDLSTDLGCFNHGASTSSYVERALRIWAPGITDRHDGAASNAALASLLRVEIVSDMPAPYTTRTARFADQRNNDFVYTFFPFGDFCFGGVTLPDGTYHYRVRISADGGQTWRERGLADQLGGEGSLEVRFRHDCSYFGGGTTDCM